MKSVTTTVTTSAPERYAFLDLTDDLRRAVQDSVVYEGAMIVFCAHDVRAADQQVGGRCDGRLRRHLTDLVPHEGVYYQHDDFEVRTQNMNPTSGRTATRT